MKPQGLKDAPFGTIVYKPFYFFSTGGRTDWPCCSEGGKR